MDNILEEIIKRIVKEVSPDKIVLFGGRAKDGNKRLGDYDICVLKKGIRHKGKVAKRIYHRLFGVGAAVDIIVQNPKKFEELKDNPFLIYREIEKFGKVLYEK
ncbi:MAG: nucleotidyltransferase domain-containing protein [bacterium]